MEEGQIALEEFMASPVLSLGEVVGSFSESGEASAVVLDVWGNGTKEGQEVMLNNADDVEAVGDDSCSGEVSSDERTVRVAQVDTDHANALSPL